MPCVVRFYHTMLLQVAEQSVLSWVGSLSSWRHGGPLYCTWHGTTGKRGVFEMSYFVVAVSLYSNTRRGQVSCGLTP